ncbi:MAG: hypothetical protein AAFV93_09005 [Chloroflexota bacterium]
MFDESKSIKAKDIVENPDAVYTLTHAYIMVEDGNPLTGSMKYYLDAMEVLFQAGYEVFNFQNTGTEIRILFFNTNAKRKNR